LNCVVNKGKIKNGSGKPSQRLGERFSFSAAVQKEMRLLTAGNEIITLNVFQNTENHWFFLQFYF